MQLNFWLYIRKQERYKCSTSKSNLHAIYLTKCTTRLLGSCKCYTNISKTIRLEMGTQCKSPSVSKSLNAGSHLPTLCICRDKQITHCYFILVLEEGKKMLDIQKSSTTVFAQTPSWTHWELLSDLIYLESLMGNSLGESCNKLLVEVS